VRRAAVLLAAVVVAGCGGSEETPDEQQAVREWIDALNDERYERAASFFADGAIVEQTREIRLDGRADAIRFNRSLPCKAEVTDLDDEGDTLLAAFRLRGGSAGGCDGGSARVRFTFRDGKFSEWRQLAEPATPPGDVL
jgi:ketosteroid isomerase-like protein